MQKLYNVRLLHAHLYYDIASNLADSPNRLKDDFPQVQAAMDWLATRSEKEPSQCLLEFIRITTKYHQVQSQNRDLVAYCAKGLDVCRKFDENPGWLYLTRAKAHFALGEWKSALVDAKSATHVSKGTDTEVYAYSVLELGRIQLNMGEYHSALNTLAQAEKQLTDLGQLEGVAIARKEVAAYYHNRGDYQHALKLFLEIDDFEREHFAEGLSGHTTFMLGIVYRKLGDLQKAKEHLQQLLQRGETEGQNSTVATATHHLAWISLDLKDLSEAQRLGEYAKGLYIEINDLRGISDADEQLGAINLARGNVPLAKKYLRQSIAIRFQFGNRHGAASSLRKLARCYFVERQWLYGLWYLGRSLLLYIRLGMLSKERLLKMIKK